MNQRFVVNQRFFWAAGILAGASACFYLGAGLGRPASAQTRIQPFTAEKTRLAPNAAGELAAVGTYTVARNSDGSTVELESIGPPDRRRYSRTITYLDDRSITFIDSLRLKTTWPQKDEASKEAYRSRLLNTQQDCGVRAPYTFIRFDRLNDEDVTVAEGTFGSAGARRRVTRFVSPRLGCEDLAYVVEEEQPDGSFAIRAQTRLSSLRIGAPDSRLFELGEGFRESTPSVALTKLASDLGIEQSEEDRRHAREMDTVYFGKLRGKGDVK